MLKEETYSLAKSRKTNLCKIYSNLEDQPYKPKTSSKKNKINIKSLHLKTKLQLKKSPNMRESWNCHRLMRMNCYNS